jgi:type IV secretory pathway TrbD component
MDRLSFFITFFTGPVITGIFAITFFSFGWYSWVAVATGVVIGWAAAWPVAYVISRKIKREDPDFDHTRVKRTDAVPRPTEREV